MNERELRRLGEMLDASGVRLVRLTSDDGSNVSGREPVPWPAALVRISAAFGWTVEEVDPDPAEKTRVLTLMRSDDG